MSIQIPVADGTDTQRNKPFVSFYKLIYIKRIPRSRELSFSLVEKTFLTKVSKLSSCLEWMAEENGTRFFLYSLGQELFPTQKQEIEKNILFALIYENAAVAVEAAALSNANVVHSSFVVFPNTFPFNVQRQSWRYPLYVNCKPK